MTTTINTVSPALLNTMNPSSATKSTSSATGATGATGADAAQLQNNFMTLLITQLKNQDPLNPMDNAQMTSQLAQLSTVSGVSQLNKTMTDLMANFQQSQSMQAVGLIGKTVVVPGNEVTLSSGAGQLGVNLDAAAKNVKVTITDSTGAVVDTLNLGALPAGPSAVPWSGKTASGTKIPDGQYKFSISATDGKSDVKATPLSVGLVASVSTGSNGVLLNLPAIGQVNYADVLQIL